MLVLQNFTKQELADYLASLTAPQGLQDGEMILDPEREKKRLKQAKMRAKMIFHWVYQRGVLDWDAMTDLSKEIRTRLKAEMRIHRFPVVFEKQSLDGTYKFLWKLDDQKTIESVIIPSALKERVNAADSGQQTDQHPEDDDDLYDDSSAVMKDSSKLTHQVTQSQLSGKNIERLGLQKERLDKSLWSRLTACVSSQVGCAMACKFCLTGVQGLDRSLEVFEIVTQIHELRLRAPITNIVFMGMGEPLHNVKNVAKACQILLDEDGLNFSKRKVTVSTSGLVPGIQELYSQTDVSLAISFNASTNAQRDHIMPVNRKWPIEVLLEQCRKVPLGSHRRITFEYVLLKDFNDQPEDAYRLIQWFRGIPSKVNLIPFNEHPGSDFKRPTDETVMAFQKILLDAGLTATVRISRGRDILAACGQLRSLFGTARGTEKHRDYQAAATPE